MASDALVELPFVYDATCVARGRHKAWPRKVRDAASFRVPAPTKAEMPVAFEVVRNDDMAAYLAAKAAPREETVGDRIRRMRGEATLPERERKAADVLQFRVFEGRLYGRVGARRFAPVDAAALVEEARMPASHFRRIFGSTALLEPSDLPVLPALVGAGFGRDATLTVGSLHDALAQAAADGGSRDATPAWFRAGSDAARVKSDDRAARLAEASACYAQALAVVEGEAWCTQGVHEPHYAVAVDHDGKNVRLRVALAGYATATLSPFRADRLDDARAFAVRTAGRLGYALSETTDEIRVLDPLAIAFDDVAALAENMFVGLDRWDLRSASDGELGAARSALLAVMEGERPSDPAARAAWTRDAFEAAERYADLLASATFVSPEETEKAGFALDRWRTSERHAFPDLDAEEEGLALGF